MTDTTKPCPFCGSTNLESGGDDKYVGMTCLDCGASGPNHYGTDYQWNSRHVSGDARVRDEYISDYRYTW